MDWDEKKRERTWRRKRENIEREGTKERLTPQVGTASRAEVQFFAPVGRGGRAVDVCAAASAALKRMRNGDENFMMKAKYNYSARP